MAGTRGENYIFGTPNVALRSFAIPNIGGTPNVRHLVILTFEVFFLISFFFSCIWVSEMALSQFCMDLEAELSRVESAAATIAEASTAAGLCLSALLPLPSGPA